MSKYTVQSIYGEFALKPAKKHSLAEDRIEKPATATKKPKLSLMQPALEERAVEEEEAESFLYEDELATNEGDAFYANFEQLEQRLLPIDEQKQHWESMKGRIRCLMRDTALLQQRQDVLATAKETLIAEKQRFETERQRVAKMMDPRLEGRDYLKELTDHKNQREEYRQQLLAQKKGIGLVLPPQITPDPVKLVETVIAKKMCAMDRTRFNMLLSHMKSGDMLWQHAHDQGRYSIYCAELEGYAIYVRVRVSDPAERHYIVVRSDLLVDSVTGLVK